MAEAKGNFVNLTAKRKITPVKKPAITRERTRWINVRNGFISKHMSPSALEPPMPIACKKLVMPKTPPTIVPPKGPSAMPAIATGIILSVIASGPILR